MKHILDTFTVLDSDVVFFATLADVPENSQHYVRRKYQYETALEKLSSYSIPMFGVVSETQTPIQTLVDTTAVPFHFLYTIPSTAPYNATNKSMKEYISMKLATSCTQFNAVNDAAWIIKVSGRYLFVDNTFVTTVKQSSSTCNFIGKYCDNNTQIFTFCFAMRAIHFRKFLENSPTILTDKNIERYVLEFLRDNKLVDTSIFVDRLGIHGNIADGEYDTY
jgi:hypothetical protein